MILPTQIYKSKNLLFSLVFQCIISTAKALRTSVVMEQNKSKASVCLKTKTCHVLDPKLDFGINYTSFKAHPMLDPTCLISSLLTTCARQESKVVWVRVWLLCLTIVTGEKIKIKHWAMAEKKTSKYGLKLNLVWKQRCMLKNGCQSQWESRQLWKIDHNISNVEITLNSYCGIHENRICSTVSETLSWVD